MRRKSSKAQARKRKPRPARSSARPKARASRQPAARGVQLTILTPGEVILGEGDVVAFDGRSTIDLVVANVGDRPIQVGSHCHFFEVNRALRFDREEAFGYRLCIPAGTAVRFEPGEEKRVTLVAIGGRRVVYGINALTQGQLDDAAVKREALARASERGYTRKGP